MDTLAAIKARYSTRAFLDKPVSKTVLEKIFHAACYAPSDKNIQSWRVAVLSGESKNTLSADLLKAHHAQTPINPDYQSFNKSLGGVYWDHAKACGIALYNALGIERDDTKRRQEQWEANYDFFGAPTGLIFYLEKRLPESCWVDMGIFLSHIMLAAQTYGVATCPQLSMGQYPDIVRKHLNLSDEYAVVCGMAMGFADNKAPVNQYRTERASLNEFVSWFD